jgi:hypothetical protein
LGGTEALATRCDKMTDQLRSRVAGRVSDMLAARLVAHVQAAGDDDQQLRLAVDKIRVSLRLFVDADLAEQVAAELLRIGKL